MLSMNDDVASPSTMPPLEPSRPAADSSLTSSVLPPWPTVVTEEQLDAIWREAGYAEQPSLQRPTVGPNAERSQTRFSQPQRTSPNQFHRMNHTGWEQPQRVHRHVSAPAASDSIIAASSTPVPPSPAPTSSFYAASPLLPFASNALNYDLMLGHVTHLYRATLQLEKRLETDEKLRAGRKQYEFTFIDPFGTSMNIAAQPWQLLSDVKEQLQAYIPQHLKAWCRIGLRQHLASDVKPLDTSSGASILALPRIELISDRTMRQTVAHAKIVRYEEDFATSSIGAVDPDSHEAAASNAAISQAAARSNMTLEMLSPPSRSSPSSTTPSAPLSLVALGELTIVVRNPLVHRRMGTSAGSSSSSTLTSQARVHSFTMEVYGLDTLTDVLSRARMYLERTYAWAGLEWNMFVVSESFTLPLDQLTSADLGTDGCKPVREEQTVFSAGLAEAPASCTNATGRASAMRGTLLLLEVTSMVSSSPTSTSSLELCLTTLTGQVLPIDLSADCTIYALKQLISKQGASSFGSLPPKQQKLVWRKAVLEDEKTLREYGIQSGEQIALLLQLREDRSSSPSETGIHLQCGRMGLNPLSTNSPHAIQILHQTMLWTLPPKSRWSKLAQPLLAKLLVRTRWLLAELYTSILSQHLIGHSSRGKAWIEEGRIREEMLAASSKQDHNGGTISSTSATPIDVDGMEDVSSPSLSSTSLKRSNPSSATDPATGIVIDLTDHDVSTVAIPFSRDSTDESDAIEVEPPAQRRRLPMV